jgi:hypothetical protein
MGKYDPLGKHLKDARLLLTFGQIENIIGAMLPIVAREKRQWWENNITGHPQARAWLNNGWEVDYVDFKQEIVIFKRR